MKITPTRQELKDPEYLTEYIGTAFINIFMFIMTFNLVLVGMNYEQYRYVIEEPFATEIKPAWCDNPEEQTNKYIQINRSTFILREPISYSPEYWEERCKYREITKEEQKELEAYYGKIFLLSLIGLTGVTASSPRARRRIKKAYKYLKEESKEN